MFIRIKESSEKCSRIFLLIEAIGSFLLHCLQRCAGAGVQESTPAGVGVLQQDPE